VVGGRAFRATIPVGAAMIDARTVCEAAWVAHDGRSVCEGFDAHARDKQRRGGRNIVFRSDDSTQGPCRSLSSRMWDMPFRLSVANPPPFHIFGFLFWWAQIY
jgi:hypothetical protein